MVQSAAVNLNTVSRVKRVSAKPTVSLARYR